MKAVSIFPIAIRERDDLVFVVRNRKLPMGDLVNRKALVAKNMGLVFSDANFLA